MKWNSIGMTGCPCVHCWAGEAVCIPFRGTVHSITPQMGSGLGVSHRAGMDRDGQGGPIRDKSGWVGVGGTLQLRELQC